MGQKKPREIGAFFLSFVKYIYLKFAAYHNNRKIIDENILLWKRLWLTVCLVKSLVTHWSVIYFFDMLELL